jgi:hypothetical protein
MPGSPVERERAAPVVADQDDAVQLNAVEPCVEIAGVVGEGVGDVGLAGAAHPDQVGCEQSPAADACNHVAPQVRGAGVAVQERERGAAS